MGFGRPVVISNNSGKASFSALAGVSLRRDDPNSFNETMLQELIDAAPDVLPVREYLPSTTCLFSLGREIPVDLGANQGFIDNLLVTNDGYLVIVETKLYRNPEGIRDVIAQTLQYGMAVGQMPLIELESRIKRGQGPALKNQETIHECVSRLAAEANQSALLADDFDEALERHLRRGEFLLLIAADGIHVGVERVTHWLNEQGNSSPFKFGLVELKFYLNGEEKLVVPRTVLKTREVSRHVVVVDIRPSAGVTAAAEVTDEFRTVTGAKKQESRSVKAAAVPLTKYQLIELIPSDERTAALTILQAIEAYPFDSRGTPTTFQIGFSYPVDGGAFYPLAHFLKGGVWVYPLTATKKLLGEEVLQSFRHEANRFAPFYREDQLDRFESTGGQVRFSQISQKANDFAAFLDSYRTKAIELLDSETID
jgi:hypothetical protein